MLSAVGEKAMIVGRVPPSNVCFLTYRRKPSSAVTITDAVATLH